MFNNVRIGLFGLVFAAACSFCAAQSVGVGVSDSGAEASVETKYLDFSVNTDGDIGIGLPLGGGSMPAEISASWNPANPLCIHLAAAAGAGAVVVRGHDANQSLWRDSYLLEVFIQAKIEDGKDFCLANDDGLVVGNGKQQDMVIRPFKSKKMLPVEGAERSRTGGALFHVIVQADCMDKHLVSPAGTDWYREYNRVPASILSIYGDEGHDNYQSRVWQVEADRLVAGATCSDVLGLSRDYSEPGVHSVAVVKISHGVEIVKVRAGEDLGFWDALKWGVAWSAERQCWFGGEAHVRELSVAECLSLWDRISDCRFGEITD